MSAPIGQIGRSVSTTPAQTTSYSITIDDYQVRMDATSGNLVATLFTAPGDGAFYEVVVRKTDSSSNTVTVTDGTFSFVLNSQNDAITCQLTSDGVWMGVAAFDVAGAGNVVGPASATDAVPALFNGTTGKIIKNSTPTGSGNPVLATSPTIASPTLTTPALGVATGTSFAATGLITSSSASAGIGYATGAGFAATQGTNRTTTVVANAICGTITLISAAGSTTPASFSVTNSAVAATDVIHVVQKSGTDLYEIFVTAVGTGSFRITSFTTGGTTTETPVFSFAVIKAVAA